MVDVVSATLVAAIIALVGTLVITVLNATWLETRRQLLKREIEKKALRDALYSEIAWTVSALADLITTPTRVDWRDFSERASSLMNLDVYGYTRKEPTLFYQLNDAHPIELFYQWMVFVQREIDETARLWSGSQQQRTYSEVEAITNYKENFLKIRLAQALHELDIYELKRRLFIPHGVEKDPREFVDELVSLMQQNTAEEHMQETTERQDRKKK